MKKAEMIYYLSGLFMACGGIWLICQYSNIYTAIGIFLVLWANNISLRPFKNYLDNTNY